MKIKNILKKIVDLLAELLGMKTALLISELKRRKDDKTAVRLMIEIIAEEEKIDKDLAVRVALCESNFDVNAKHWNASAGFDRGLYQWNEKYHPEISDETAYDPELATRAFCRAVKEGHLSWWNASKSCWEAK